MSDGHCDHCQVGCQGQEGRTHLGTESQDFLMMWSTGHCPACKERARIVAWLRERAGWAISQATDGDVALEKAATRLESGRMR